MRSREEKKVLLKNVDLPEARSMVNNMGEGFVPDSVKRAVVHLTTVDMYSFRAEYTVKDQDMIFHFYLPTHAEAGLKTPEGRQAWMDYLLHRFPTKLNVVAQEHFGATAPRLQAKYTEEVASWWLKAQGFGLSSDPNLLATRFFEKLDAALKEKEHS